MRANTLSTKTGILNISEQCVIHVQILECDIRTDKFQQCHLETSILCHFTSSFTFKFNSLLLIDECLHTRLFQKLFF